MQDKEITKVYQTNDYDKFKVMLGNRNINLASVAKIQNSIAESGFRMCPILVNENFEIIDGQHRFTALKFLKLPIYYVIENGLTVNDCKILNLNTKNWTLDDYIKSYADLGNLEFIKLLEIKKQLKTSSSILYCLFDKKSHVCGHGVVQSCKNGDLKISFSVNKIKDVLKYHDLLKNQFACHKWYKGLLLRESLAALKFFFFINDFKPNFDLNRFKELLESKSNNLVQAFTVADLIKSFGDLYNKGLKLKFDFEELYEEYKKLIPTGIFLEDKE